MTNGAEGAVDGKDTGPEKVYQFLSRSGFLNTLADEPQFHDWMNKLSAEDFQNHLVRLNGLVRQIKIKDRRVDGENVAISNEMMGTSYLPPRPEYKDELMRRTFEGAKNLPKKDAGLLLYLSLQAIHPFVDGNGRTGRLLYLLLESSETKTPLDKPQVESFLMHEGDSGPGREAFEKKVKSPNEVYPVIEYLLAQDALNKDIIENTSRLYSGLQSGEIEDFTNEKITKETKEKLTLIMSEAGSGNFTCRDIALARYLQERGLIGTYTVKDTDRKLFRMDGQKILEDVSESDAKEIIEIFATMKKQFVEKLIDVIARPDEYKYTSGTTIKERMYK